MIYFFAEKNNNKDLSLRKKEKVKKLLHQKAETATRAMSSNDLRELFEACKTGDLVKVKKLLTPQNVNEIGKPSWVY